MVDQLQGVLDGEPIPNTIRCLKSLTFQVVIHHGRDAHETPGRDTLATGLVLGQAHFFVELGVFVFVLALAEGDGRAGMFVQDASIVFA